MTGFGAQAYRTVAVASGVANGDPHEMVLMLFDGALAAIHQATGHLKARRIAEKCAAISKAVRIVDEGLKVSLDVQGGGDLAQRLSSLYDYTVLRLLQANLRNDDAALAEAGKLLTELRSAWAEIGSRPAAPQPVAAADDPAERRFAASV